MVEIVSEKGEDDGKNVDNNGISRRIKRRKPTIGVVEIRVE
jgi:hypothetical protein